MLFPAGKEQSWLQKKIIVLSHFYYGRPKSIFFKSIFQKGYFTLTGLGSTPTVVMERVSSHNKSPKEKVLNPTSNLLSLIDCVCVIKYITDYICQNV